jgi:2-phospho-L-lactate guanylyltransferase
VSANRFRLLVPVQRLDSALPRMKASASQRRDLALAFARDTVDAALKSSEVSEVVVITEDSVVKQTFRDTGVRVTQSMDPRSVWSAVTTAHRATSTRDVRPTAVVMGDLPALMPAELNAALRRAAEGPWSVYCEDLLSGGTTFYASCHSAFIPTLGPRSAAQNASLGAMRIGRDLPGLRCDVDTLEDLKMAKHLGVGVRTSQVLARYPRLRAARATA